MEKKQDSSLSSQYLLDKDPIIDGVQSLYMHIYIYTHIVLHCGKYVLWMESVTHLYRCIYIIYNKLMVLKGHYNVMIQFTPVNMYF